MKKILLTNDDSHRSPLLELIIEKLAPLGELIIVVPKHEQSWKGKSMTRFGALHVENLKLWGHEAFTVDGTPADCINLAVHHLTGGPPNLVVSGINAGLNTGIGFLFASGTVGACFEANIAGIPAIALSQCFDTYTRNRYLPDYRIARATLSRLRRQSSEWLDGILGAWFADAEISSTPITWNVNFPFSPARKSLFRLCPLGISTYGSCFKRGDLGYRHELEDVYPDPRRRSDNVAVYGGHVSVTPLDIRCFGQFDPQTPFEMGKRFVGDMERFRPKLVRAARRGRVRASR